MNGDGVTASCRPGESNTVQEAIGQAGRTEPRRDYNITYIIGKRPNINPLQKWRLDEAEDGGAGDVALLR